MLRKFFLIAALGMFLPAAAMAQFNAGDWELTLNGSGLSDDDFDNTSFAAGGTLGYFLSDAFEVNLRQQFTVADTEDAGSSWAGATRVGADFHFDMDRWQPFVGVAAGYVYGDDVDDVWVGGPEAGIKFFVNSTTFILASVTYEFLLEDGDDRDAFEDGNWVYNLGIGFRW